MNKLWWNFEVKKYSQISVIFIHQNLASHFIFHQLLWINFTKISDIFWWVLFHQFWWIYFWKLEQIIKIFTNFGDKVFENFIDSTKLSPILVNFFLQNHQQILSPIEVKFSSLNHPLFFVIHQKNHQNWWKFSQKFVRKSRWAPTSF